MCCDWTALSPTCQAKGCSACEPCGDEGHSNNYQDEEMLKQTVRIRLYGVDCPESDQPYGGRATEFVLNRVLGSYVTVAPIDTDFYGRTVAIVNMDDFCLNEALIEEGFAWVYTDYCDRPECTFWLELENQARSAYRGLWQSLDPVPPWIWRHTEQTNTTFRAVVGIDDSARAATPSTSWHGSVVDVIDGDTISVSRTSSSLEGTGDSSNLSGDTASSSNSNGGGGGCFVGTVTRDLD